MSAASSPVITALRAWVFRVPIDHPVTTSFGQLRDRPAVFVRVDASDGAWGWGEVFCNFPQVGAEHRARLLNSLFAPVLMGQPCDDPPQLWRQVNSKLHRVAIQCGEAGPFAQVSGAIDQAVWDMNARRAGVPLWRFIAPEGKLGQPRVRVYASGLGPQRVAETALEKLAQGYRAFKFKVGFGADIDANNFRELRQALGNQHTVMVDANQAWQTGNAVQHILRLQEFEPLWVEEPIAADEPHSHWKALAQSVQPRLAAGENIRGHEQFDETLEAGYLGFIQPDVAKWGGISGCRDVALKADKQGVIFCPHWLGGGIGLLASLHLRAALGADGYAEVDANPNPLREWIFEPQPQDGWVQLSDDPGLGVEPDLVRLSQYQTLYT